jgi:hypothetical protein
VAVIALLAGDGALPGLARLEEMLRSTVGQLNRAGARVYAVDTRGIAGFPSDAMNSLDVDTGIKALFSRTTWAPSSTGSRPVHIPDPPISRARQDPLREGQDGLRVELPHRSRALGAATSHILHCTAPRSARRRLPHTGRGTCTAPRPQARQRDAGRTVGAGTPGNLKHDQSPRAVRVPVERLPLCRIASSVVC